MIKLKDLLVEDLNPRKYSEIRGQARYLKMSVSDLMKAVKKQDDNATIDAIDYILGKAQMMKEILTDKRYESINEDNVTYKLKGFTNTKMDELDAELSRLGIKGTPDFNKMTYTIHMKGSNSSTLDKIMKKKGGKKIR